MTAPKYIDGFTQPLPATDPRSGERASEDTMDSLTFSRLRTANIKRDMDSTQCLSKWTSGDWAAMLNGEVGETTDEVMELLFALTIRLAKCTQLGDTVKKMRRLETGDDGPGSTSRTMKELQEALAGELADLVHCADLLAACTGIDLGKAVRDKFNEVSIRRDLPHRL